MIFELTEFRILGYLLSVIRTPKIVDWSRLFHDIAWNGHIQGGSLESGWWAEPLKFPLKKACEVNA
jgi:hypothetical protein